MNEIVKFNQVEEKIITIREQKVILDSDVAAIYDVETREINQAIKNNPAKFPDGYIFQLDKDEWTNLKSKILTSKWGGKNKLPNVFTKKGLYMLATILKSPQATDATIAIVEVFEKISELSQTVADLIQNPDDVQKQAIVMQKTSEVLSDIVEKELKTTGTETTFELNLLSTVKIKHTIKREVKN